MAGGYGTTPEEMARAGRRALRVDEQIQADLATLRSQVAAIGGGWRGAAATSFNGLMQQWDTSARKLSGALQGIGGSIVASGRSYEQTETEQAARISEIASGLS